ncbi:MAG: type VI secretion system-associated protein TagF [Pseudorhodobacter sp.]
MNEKPPNTARSGYFGKVPSQGDFVMRGLSRPVADVLDQWMRECIRASQRQMGRKWLDAFLVAPIRRFALPNGTVGADPLLGVIMPSVDRIGRYFPLIVATGWKDGLLSQDALAKAEPWFAAAEALALSTLEPDFSMANFNERADQLSLPSSSINCPAQDAPFDNSLWWVGPLHNDTLTTAQGLPDPIEFAARFLVQDETTPARNGQASFGSQPATTPRILLDTDCEGAALKGTRSASLTDLTIINSDRQSMSLISGIGNDPRLPGAVAMIGDTLAGIENPFSMNDLLAEAKGKLGTANALLRARALPTGEIMAASTVTLLVQAQRYAVLWAGNARAYLLRNGEMTRLTRDHTEARLRNLVTRAIGASATLSLDSAIGRVVPGDRFVLCSQGICQTTTDEEIARTLGTASSAHQAVTHLTQDAIISGAALDASALAVILSER